MSPRTQKVKPKIRMQNKMRPALFLFVSANIANAANLLFNMIFARLMGPEAFSDLTFLLTLKLGILCVLSAFQLALSQYTAKAWFGKNKDTRKSQIETFAALITLKSLWFSVPLMLIAFSLAEGFARAFQFQDLKALLTLMIILPVLFPMIVYRGLAQGRIDLPRIIGSVQGEWAVRLLGGLILWTLGLGLMGISIAVVLSILTGCLLSMRRNDVKSLASTARLKTIKPYSCTGAKPVASPPVKAPNIFKATTPFLALQFAQVLILDGDIILAKANMNAELAGYIAGLMLLQRIFFFAFLSFSSLLLPVISAKIEKSTGTPSHIKNENKVDRPLKTEKHRSQHAMLEGNPSKQSSKVYDNVRRGRSDLMMMLGGVMAISVPALFALYLIPALGVTLILGPEFASVQPLAVISGATGALFTLTHLCTVYWLANGQTRMAYVLLVLAVVQVMLLGMSAATDPDFTVTEFATLKLSLQSLICAALLFYTFIATTKRRTPSKSFLQRLFSQRSLRFRKASLKNTQALVSNAGPKRPNICDTT